MLILTRRYGENVRLTMDGLNLGTIHVIRDPMSNTPRLGFDLHPKLTITRGELADTYDKNFKGKK